ncbi:MAG: T9SS type A sorting domain-containing protein, partial [Candidatus Marinimicrobia bacterium]|nr:T9SS type A sorting domain-containing protein [Candidatus Neomarinimicrobiota bacterium]
NGFNTFGLSRERDLSQPKAYSIGEAYPNPFNPVTNITFGIENDALVMARVFDVTGREVAELANGVYSAGYHVVNWNADSHSSGLYFLTITVDGFASGNGQHSVHTQKLMLLK